MELLSGRFSIRRHTKRHAQKLITSQCKSMVNPQYDPLIFLLTCEIHLHLSNFFCYNKHENVRTVKQRYEIGHRLTVVM